VRRQALVQILAMENSLPDPLEPPARDLGDATLDKLLGTDHEGIALPHPDARGTAGRPRLPFWTRTYLYLLGASAPVDESPKSLHDRLVDAVIVVTIVLLLAWIAYLTLRGWALYSQR
jgi:hypothetical protein